MAEECTHNCSTCKSNCASKIQKLSLKEGSSVKKVIGVFSAKGGVGKSLVTSLMTARLSQEGYRTAVLDADLTGASIPTAFGVRDGQILGDDKGYMLPVTTKSGIQIISLNFMLPNESDPVLWRSSMLLPTLKNFWQNTQWTDVDYMFVDMPPGTGDIPLTIFQSVPLDGIIIVASPQGLVKMIVEKAVKMAQKMNIPVYGLIENMSYVQCPDCDKKIKIFGESHAKEIAVEYGIPLLAEIPVDASITKAVDEGKVESVKTDFLDAAVKMLPPVKK